MKILSVSNEKGGVGKTVLAVNLAWELSRMGHCVLVVDVDQQCDLTKILYRGNDIPQNDIFKLLNGQCKVSEACFQVKDNLFIIPGSKNMKNLKKKRQALLKDILMNDFLENVDIVIIDNPPSTSMVTLLVYVAATDILIVTESETFSTHNISNYMEDLTDIKDLNPNLTVLGIVANKIDLRRNLTKKALREMKQVFGDSLLKTYVSNNIAVPTSLKHGQAVRELGWSNPAMGQLQRVSEEIEERLAMGHGDGQALGEQA